MNYRGSYCALITPFKDDAIDKDSLKKIIKWHISQGTKGVIPCGTTGESPTLSHNEHKEVVEIATEVADNKIQVMAGTGSNSTKEAIALTNHAREAGADSALVVVPYYNKPSQQGLIEHYLRIADAVPLPIFIYNIPGRSVIDMENETIEKLAEHENIIGIKDASNDLSRPTYINKYIKHKKFFQLSGEDATQMAFLAQGGDGVISVAANIVPKQISEMHDYWFSHEVSKAMVIDQSLVELYKALFIESNPCPVKYAAYKLGMCNNELRLPLTKITEINEKKMIKIIEKLKISYI
ncbi:4-hydroxy-tetrahydrodipicolinate synthase [Alphaproteobacteria bacterium]|nr:4-hydroxy-tetrahydrodipicolinate synthase [Alphaproteobacteria bacterium]